MVPIYSLDAWAALRFVDARAYLDPIRECYEAYAIYSFFMFLMSYLEDELGDVDAYLATKAQVPHMAFVAATGLVRPWPMGAPFLFEVRKGVANYVIARPLCTALAAITDAFGLYGEGQLLRPDRAYPYLAMLTNCSQAWALYCLVLLYRALRAELAPIRPLAKFVCIKAVVFLTFWQGLSLHLAGSLGFLPKGEEVTTYSAADAAEGFQDFLICVEMLFAAAAHAYAFPPGDYMDESLPTAGFLANLRCMFDVRDVASDVRGVVGDHLSAAQAAAHGAAAHGAGPWRPLAKAAGQAVGSAVSAVGAGASMAATAGGAVLATTSAPARGLYHHLVHHPRGSGGEEGEEEEGKAGDGGARGGGLLLLPEEEDDGTATASPRDDDDDDGGGGGDDDEAGPSWGGGGGGGGGGAPATAAVAASVLRRKR